MAGQASQLYLAGLIWHVPIVFTVPEPQQHQQRARNEVSHHNTGIFIVARPLRNSQGNKVHFEFLLNVYITGI